MLGKGRKLTAEHRAKIGAAVSVALKGHKVSAETRAKISAAMSVAARGRKLSSETRGKIGAASKGRKQSPEQRAKIGAANRRRATPCWCAKLGAAMSIALKGYKQTPEHVARSVASRHTSFINGSAAYDALVDMGLMDPATNRRDMEISRKAAYEIISELD